MPLTFTSARNLYIRSKTKLYHTMRSIVLFLFAGLIAQSCLVVKPHTKKGNHRRAVLRASNHLQRTNKIKTKDALALEVSFQAEQQRLLQEIDQLKRDGSPDSWKKVYSRYEELNSLQQSIAPFLPIYINKEFREADIYITDLSEELYDAKVKATEVLYAEVQQLMASNSKADARLAYAKCQDILNLMPNYKDVPAIRDQAYQKGIVFVNYAYYNDGVSFLPASFENQLQQFPANELRMDWISMHYGEDMEEGDARIELRIVNVEFSPERVSQSQYSDKKTIEDGFEYELDSDGNVKKDSLGNDIKTPKEVEIVANVFVTNMEKTGNVQYSIDIYNGRNQLISSNPFTEVANFTHQYARFQGDDRALTKRSKRLLRSDVIAFPSNQQMIMDVGSAIRSNTINHIRNNQNAILNSN